MTTHDQYEDLVAAYAFGTADGEERRLFEAHLSGCPDCRRAVDDLKKVSAGLGLAAEPVAPPPDLRERVMRAAEAQSGRQVPTPGERSGLPPGGRVVAQRQAPPAWRLALAASVLLAGGLGIYAWTLRSQNSGLRELLAQATAQSNRLRAELAAARVDTVRLTHTVSVIGAPDVLRVELRGQADAPQSTGRAYISSSAGVIISARGLPIPSSGRTYQLWVIPAGPGGAPVDAGTFTVDTGGAVTLNRPMPPGVAAAAAVAVSDEPAGGSPTGGPTGPVVLLGRTS